MKAFIDWLHGYSADMLPNDFSRCSIESLAAADAEEGDPISAELNPMCRSCSRHPIVLAALVHLNFILVHPFIDGNGRTARLLTNAVLMHFGYPPIIIPSSGKVLGDYYRALQRAQPLSQCVEKQVISSEPFVRIIAQQVIDQLRLSSVDQKCINIEE